MKTLKKLKTQSRISVAVIASGIVLMAGKIYADSEPGLIPLLLVVLGTAWFFITRVRTRYLQKQAH